MPSYQGNPCWFELGTTDLDAAQRFYADILGWTIESVGMDGFDYHLSKAGDEMVAGLTSTAGQVGAPPPNWLTYIAVDDCDAVAEAIRAAGGSILKGPEDIPDTGRYAVAADPQGAHFGILQPDVSKMSPEDVAKAETTGAFDQTKEGHGNWLELMSSDPAKGFDFYSGLFGWTKSSAMDMGEMGTYQLFAHKGKDIGGMMGKTEGQASAWTPYFGVNGIDAAIGRIKAGGGTLLHGPSEVPGGAFIAYAADPQGAMFAIVGPKDVS